MKNLSMLRNKIALLFITMIGSASAFAQDNSSATHTSTSTSSTTGPNVPADWYMMPWVWVVGGIVLVLILFALLRGNGTSRTDVQRTTITRTDEINTDV